MTDLIDWQIIIANLGKLAIALVLSIVTFVLMYWLTSVKSMIDDEDD